MGRSVHRPSQAVAVAYRSLYDDTFEDDPDLMQIELEYLECWIKDTARELWPSFRPSDGWIDQEGIVLLENALGVVGYSEYCGLVSVWLVPKTDEYGWEGTANLCDPWCQQIADKFRDTFCTLQSLGTMSNGEQVFRQRGAS